MPTNTARDLASSTRTCLTEDPPGLGLPYRGPPLRVALFAEQGHPDGTFTSGVTRLTRRFYWYCAAHAVPLDMFTYHDVPGTTREGQVRFHAVRPRTPVDFHGLKVDPWDILPIANRALVEPAVRGRYDVVLATAPGIGTQAQIVARRMRLPLVMLFTTDLPSYAAERVRERRSLALLAEGARGAAWKYLEWLYDRSRTDLVLAPTRAFRRTLESRVTAPVAVLGRGSDTLTFDAPADLAGHRGPPTLLFVGRLDYGQKNLNVLCRAVRAIPACRLLLVGEGEHRARLARELGPEIAAGRVCLAGRINDPHLLRHAYLGADLFAFPSVLDTLGQVVMEAQRAGLPVVVRDRGGPAELVVDGASGFVTGDDDVFIARCRQLVEDRRLRVRMGRAAWEHAANLPDWDDVVQRLLEHLRGVATSAGRSPKEWLIGES